ncbi:nucleoside hydrolase [Enterococcus crotali]|uniref:nucleoside hydrolase n=1 Tax=Enterococcus crotali TaxID=1453587 RepID=UPI00046FC77A|nr:nucleoside hydrolase [Enterococcus crotali]
MKTILIDCDPGHDDALAILTALANEEKLSILGISTIGGNQTLAKVTKNAQNVLAFVDAKIPLAIGQAGPLVKQLEPSDEAHGKSGMDGPYFEQKEYPIASTNAVDFMFEKIMTADEPVIIVGLGPLTNIALLLKSHPEVHKKIAFISLMGGGIEHGNVTSLAEFNIYVDPEAAHIVFHAGLPIVMSGLDVTEKAEITVPEIATLKNKGRVSNLAYELLHFYNQSGQQFGFIDSPIHDLCAIAYLIAPEIFTGNYYYVDVATNDGVSRGQTFADKRLVTEHEKNTLVLETVNREKFVKLLISALEKLDKRG